MKITLDVAGSAGAHVESQLDNLAGPRMREPALRVGRDLKRLGMAPEPSTPVTFRVGQQSWIFVPWEKDPFGSQTGGRLHIPSDARDELVALADAGVDPDVLWVAHEMPKTWNPGDPIDLPPSRNEQRALRICDGLSKVVGLGVGVASAPLGFLAQLDLDPIVLGGIRHPRDPEAVLWFELARWTWE